MIVLLLPVAAVKVTVPSAALRVPVSVVETPNESKKSAVTVPPLATAIFKVPLDKNSPALVNVSVVDVKAALVSAEAPVTEVVSVSANVTAATAPSVAAN